MKILVTGTAGRIGRSVALRLVERGDTVVGYDAAQSTIASPNFESIVADFSNREALQDACKGIDAILHMGAYMTWDPSEQPRLFEANVTGTLNLLAAAVESGVEKFVFASSGEVYPDRNPVYLPIDENHPTKPNSPYGLSKLMAENAVRFYERAHGLPSVILRFSHTQNASELLDPKSFFSGSRFYLHAKIRQQRGFGNHVLADLLESHDSGSNKLVVSCNADGRPHRMGISDTRDTVSGVIHALDVEAAAGETFNLAPPSATSFDDAVDLLQSATGLEAIRINLPGPDLYYETNGEKAKEILGLEPEWTFEKMVADTQASQVDRS